MGCTVNRSMMLAGAIPVVLLLVSRLLLRTRRLELAKVTMDSWSRSFNGVLEALAAEVGAV